MPKKIRYKSVRVGGALLLAKAEGVWYINIQKMDGDLKLHTMLHADISFTIDGEDGAIMVPWENIKEMFGSEGWEFVDEYIAEIEEEINE